MLMFVASAIAGNIDLVHETNGTSQIMFRGDSQHISLSSSPFMDSDMLG